MSVKAMKNKQVFYAIYHEDDQHVFGPFLSEDEAEDYAWKYSLRNGFEDSYGGSSTEIIDETEYQKRQKAGTV